MKPLTIGQLVQVSAIAELLYVDNIRRVATHTVEPFLAAVTGQVRKYTGYYDSGYTFEGFQEDAPHLKVDKAVTLWEVRAGLQNKPVLVCDPDLEAVALKCPLPRLAVGVPRRTDAIDDTFSKPTKSEPLLLTHQPGLPRIGIAVLDARAVDKILPDGIWLPMDEAPRDGTPIVVLVNDEEVEVRWAQHRSDPGGYYGAGWEDTYNRYSVADEPEGWRPA